MAALDDLLTTYGDPTKPDLWFGPLVNAIRTEMNEAISQAVSTLATTASVAEKLSEITADVQERAALVIARPDGSLPTPLPEGRRIVLGPVTGDYSALTVDDVQVLFDTWS